MPLILDTYNILHTVGVLPPELAGLDIEGLAQLLTRSRYRSNIIELVCDGLPRGGAMPALPDQMHVHYSGPSATADDLIATMVVGQSHPRRFLVVSSDLQVQKDARRAGCRAIGSEQFLHRVLRDVANSGLPGTAETAPARPTAPLPRNDVDRWVRDFDLSEAELNIRPAEPLAPPPANTEQSAPPSAQRDDSASSGAPTPPPRLSRHARLDDLDPESIAQLNIDHLMFDREHPEETDDDRE